MAERRTLGGFINLLMTKANVSNKELAERLAVRADTVSKWRGDKQTPSIQYLNELIALAEPNMDIGDCLYLPAEVSQYRAVEVAINILQRQREEKHLSEVKKPGGKAGNG